MRKIVEQSKEFTKRDSVNSRNGFPLQDLEDKTIIEVKAAAIMEDTDEETGEVKEIGVLVTADQTYHTTISSTVIDTLYDVVDIINDEGPVKARLGKRTSKVAKRTFLTLDIL